MKVVFSVSEDTEYEHVRAQSTDAVGTLGEFEGEIKKRYPRFDQYYWRHRPSREVHRDFATDGHTVKFYARFSVRKKPNANRVGPVWPD